MTPGLYVVATPIGHLDDLGPRAARTLREVDVVAAEDTRVTRVLLRHAGSSARLISARAHNEAQAADTIVALIAGGFIAAPIAARLAGKLPKRTAYALLGVLVIVWSLRIIVKVL